MADGVRVEVSGADEVSAALGRVAAQAGAARGLYDNIGLSLVTSTQHRFETGTAPGGSPWPPSIRAMLQGGKTLIDSARLMQSMTFEASDAGVAVGTNVLYAAIHQQGGTIRPVSKPKLTFRIGKQWISALEVTIPARPFLGLDDDDAREIEALADDWLLGPRGAGDAH